MITISLNQTSSDISVDCTGPNNKLLRLISNIYLIEVIGRFATKKILKIITMLEGGRGTQSTCPMKKTWGSITCLDGKEEV